MTTMDLPATVTGRPVPPAGSGAATLVVFSVTLFLSAVLLFGVQPMVGRLVLPVLGGTPAVWNACVVFFQAALLVGYVYAHVLTRHVPARGQLIVHAAVLLLPLVVLPLARPEVPGDVARQPVLWLLYFLAAAVALPFVAVSTSAPLLQRWFSATDHPAARDPYFLYAASNAGSFTGLLAYPFLVEPSWNMATQARAWTAGYVLLVGLVLACGVTAFARGFRSRAAGAALKPATAPHETARSRLVARAWWFGLSALPTSLMLGVTTYLTTDLAPVPLLWVVPLALYLLAYALAFAAPARQLRSWIPPLLVAVLIVAVPQVVSRAAWPLAVAVPVHLAAFTAACFVCLIELASRRPPVERLTEFYIWVAVGGVVGGAFNAFLAPVVFDSLLEYPLVMAACCALLPFARAVYPEKAHREVAFSVAACTLGAGAILAFVARPWGAGTVAGTLALSFGVGLAWRRPRWVGACAAIVLVVSLVAADRGSSVLVDERSFFGVYRLTASSEPATHSLVHGTTLHGSQLWDGREAPEPLTYFHRTGPIGDVFAAAQAADPSMRVGVIGLGAGSLAAYARPDDAITFFEIDPLVERIARNPSYFTFLEGCAGRCGVEIGDARITLATPRQEPFDLLVLDAFSSDAIPMHLLTAEALQVYLSRLSPEGAIAYHISNRHLRLLPVVAALAEDAKLEGRSRSDSVDDEGRKLGKTSSHWVVLGRPGHPVISALDRAKWVNLSSVTPGPLWTDGYSSIFGVLGRPR